MDPLTHSLFGAALADTGAGRRTALATTTLILAANLPDVDALTYLAGGDTALYLRRGWTHGVLAMAVLPAVLAATVATLDRWWQRRSPSDSRPAASFRHLLPLAYLGVISHPILDWLNTYGVRFLMPFDDSWFYGDTLFIIDPWLWLALGGAVFLRHSSSRRGLLAWSALAAVTTAIVFAGSRDDPAARALWLIGLTTLAVARFTMRADSRTGSRLTIATLVAAGLYIGLLVVATVAARHDVESRLVAAGTAVDDVMVGPRPIRPLQRAVIVDTGEHYQVGSYDWLGDPRLTLDPRPVAKPPPTPVVEAALAAPCLRGMAAWVRYPWVEVESAAEGGHVVHLMDARYALARTSSFGGGSVRLGSDLVPECDPRSQDPSSGSGPSTDGGR